MNRKERIAAEDLLRDYRLQIKLARDRHAPDERDAALQTANQMLPRVNAILRSLVPDIAPISGSLLPDHEEGLGAVFRAEDVLGDWDEMVGDDGETVQFGVPLNALDVVVLEAARQDWYHGQYRQAVASAAAKLNKYVQDRLDVHDISDSELMSHAFSDSAPQPGRPRLRCPGNPASMTVKSMQAGAKLFAMGAYQAIRNPAVHWTGSGNPTSAAEQLVALSVIARWVRYWNVERHKPPVPTCP